MSFGKTPPSSGTFLAACDQEPGSLRIGRYITPAVPGAEVAPECVAAYEHASQLLESLGHTVEDHAGSVETDEPAALLLDKPVDASQHPEAPTAIPQHLAVELLNVLAKIQGLRVSARASSFHFKGKDTPLGEIGRALKVATVLDGSVRKAGSRVRISVQLVKVSDGYHLWSETYDRTLEDIFAVQDDIAQCVVKELRGALLGERQEARTGSPHAELASVANERTYDSESYDLYLRGRYLFGASDDGPVRAQELFRSAIERSPQFALAYSGLGESYVVQSWLGSRDRDITV